MKKKDGRSGGDVREKEDRRFNGSDSKKITKMRRNMQRLGGRGLSLEAFANAKSGTNNYNPSMIKKQREFYKNAKFVRKYKRTLKQEEHSQTDQPLATRPLELDQGETEVVGGVNNEKKKNKKKNARSARALYEMKREEEERARRERETIIQLKDEERRRAEARRKALKERMLKKTKSGQPVMKYRIERVLETLRG